MSSVQDSTYEELLAASRELLIHEGVKGISVRRLAERAGCTTMAIYSRFGGKNGLLAALFDEGFAQLKAAQENVPSTLSGTAYLLALCRAYRQTARTYPHHYALMLGSLSGEFTPPPASREKGRATLVFLARAIAQHSNETHEGLAESLAQQLFAFCHGWVSLEDTGIWGDEAQCLQKFEAGVKAFVLGSGLFAPTERTG